MQTCELTQYQKQFWLEWQLAPNTLQYNTPLTFKLTGPLDKTALERALTHFNDHYHQGADCHVVARDDSVYFVPSAVVDTKIVWENAPANQPIRDIIRDKLNHVFNLKQSPLAHFVCVSLTETETLLILNWHHIITDAITAKYIIYWVSALYNYYAYQTPLPKTTLPTLQDNLIHCQQNLTDCKRNETLRYWRESLAGKQLKLHLPLLNPNAAPKACTIKFVAFDPDQAAALRALSKAQKTTLFLLFTALYSATLKFYAQQDEFVLSFPVDVRPKGFDTLAGCHINNVPLRVNINAKQPFVKLIESITQEFKRSKPYRDRPIAEVIGNLKSNHLIAPDDLPNIMIQSTHLCLDPLTFQGITCEPILVEPLETPHDVTLAFEFREQLTFRFAFCNRYFNQTGMDSFITLFKQLTTHCLTQCDEPINRLYAKVLSQHPLSILQGAQATPTKATVFGLFEQQALKSPDSIALVHEREKVSYQVLLEQVELTAQAVSAYYLETMSAPLQASNLIGLYSQKSIPQVIALLAILRLGATVCPLSPNMPQARLQTILDSHDIQFALCAPEHQEALLTSKPELTIYSLTKVSPPEQNKPQPMLENPLAYVIFTSGTTGHPKGVMVKQTSLLCLLEAIQATLADLHDIRCLSFTEINFDIYWLELLLPILTGGRHIIGPNPLSLNERQLSKLMNKHQPNLIQTTPSIWQRLLNLCGKQRLPVTALCGGEALTMSLANTLLSRVNSLWNMYGPTETTIWSCCTQITDAAQLSIGSPIRGTQALILDNEENIRPAGFPGELALSGMGLAQGYYQAESETRARFKNLDYGRVYKTGDGVCLNESGNLIYTGRLDGQFKYRGMRFEQCEVELAMNAHPDIDQSALIMINDAPIVFELYYTTLSGTPVMQSSLTAHLQTQLGTPLPIQHYHHLPEMPLSSNHKIDRDNLRLKRAGDQNYYSFQAHDSVEYQIQTIWARVLKNKNINIDTPLLQLGGDSLMSIEIINMMNKHFSIDLPVSWLSHYNTISTGAKALREMNTTAPYQPIITFNEHGDCPPVFMVHPTSAGAEVYNILAKFVSDDIPFYAIDSLNLNGHEALLPTLHALASRYIRYIKEVRPTGPYILGGWSFGGLIAFEMARLLCQTDEIINIYMLDSHAYRKHQLKNIENNVSRLVLMHEFPNRRGEYFRELPEAYIDKLTRSIHHEIKLNMNYVYQQYHGRVTLLKSMGKRKWLEHKHNGWKKYAPNLKIIEVPYTHISLLEDKNMQHLASIISADILDTSQIKQIG